MGAGKKIRERRWYIYTEDAYTNDAVRMELPGNEIQEFVCADGIRRKLWECSFNLVRFMWKSRPYTQHHFRVFQSEGNGKPRDITVIANRLFGVSYAAKRATSSSHTARSV